MKTSWKCTGALLCAGTLAIAGCSSSGDAGPKGDQGDPGINYVPGGGPGLKIAVTGVTVASDKSVSVRYTAKDDAGAPLTGVTPRFAIASIAKDGDKVLPYVVLTKTGTKAVAPTDPEPLSTSISVSPTAVTPTANAAATTGVLVDNGSGSYTYTFPAGGMTSAPGTGSNEGKTVYTLARPVQVEPTSSTSHTIWIQAARQSDASDPRTITPVNVEYNFIPSGSGTPVKREVASTAGCNKCHDRFRKYTVENGFHSGGRIEAPFCGICHNPERASGRDDAGVPAAEAARFVHRIHNGEELRKVTTGTSTVGYQDKADGSRPSCSTSSPCTCTVTQPCRPTAFHGIDEVTYPQDIRNCKMCHEGAAQGSQWYTRPNRAACGSCHDYVSFVDTSMSRCQDAGDKSAGCRHSGGAQSSDVACATCHDAAAVQGYHVAVATPDPNNSLTTATITNGTVTTGTQPGNATQVGQSCSTSAPCTCTAAAPCAPSTANANTNAGWLPAAGAVPAGADVVTYEMPADPVALSTTGNPVVKFKLKKNGADVAFDAASYGAGVDKEIMPGFVGSPSVYVLFSLAQDGIESPADFNGQASGYIRNLWNGSATVTFKVNGVNTTVPVGTISQTPDGGGYYTVTLTSVKLPTDGSVKLLTGGVGFSYSLTSTQPLTQINLPKYPFDPVARTGGLVAAAPSVFKVANGASGRRAIVDNEKCKACHEQLGANPTFHAGQRNDGQTCAFCHNPNRTSSGWAANSSTFIHGIHGTDKRSVPFSWHSACPSGSTYDSVAKACKDSGGNVVTPSPWYPEVGFPGYLADCQTCHLPGTYDLSANLAAFPNLLWSTVAATSTSSPTLMSGISLCR
jgi:OmcA/MtrC family decaheme c-type cytochrome